MVEWASLEYNMSRVLLAMRKLDFNIAFPPKFTYWPEPQRYGYIRSYRSQKTAQIAAYRSKNAFVPLMATVSLWMRLLDAHMEKIAKPRAWRTEVAQRSGVDHQWVAELLATLDASVHRVGGIIDVPSCHFLAWLPEIWRDVEQIVFSWGSYNACDTFEKFRKPQLPRPPTFAEVSSLRQRAFPRTIPLQSTSPSAQRFEGKFIGNDQFRRFVKSEEQRFTAAAEANEASRLAAAKAAEADEASRFAATHAAETAEANRLVAGAEEHTLLPPQFPPVEPNSGQRPGENMDAFFERRKKSNAERAKKETDGDRKRRLARQENAKKQIVPGRRGALIFIWEKSELPGFFIRRPGGRNNAEYHWGQYGVNQRRYDSFHDQWDLCFEFDPNDCPEPEFEDDCGAVILEEGKEEDSQPNVLKTLEADLSAKADLGRLHFADFPESGEHQVNPILDIAYDRYGFLIPNYKCTLLPGAPAWSQVLKFLGGHGHNMPADDVKCHLQNFFHYLMQSDTAGISAIPADYIDLLHSKDDLCKARSLLSIRTDFLDSQKSYILTPLPEDGLKYEIVISSPTTVVEILRGIDIGDDKKPRLDCMVPDLLSGLRSLRTCIRAPPRSTCFTTARTWSSALGYRPKYYQFTEVDYYSYLTTLEDFFHSPRGRAALLKGGIIARLAEQFITFEDVGHGPSDDVLQFGHCQKSSGDPSLGYWDDELTVEEIDLICGVYRVDTGKCICFPSGIDFNTFYFRTS